MISYRFLLRCAFVFLTLLGIPACGSKHPTNNEVANAPSQLLPEYLRRGLSGDPRTLDPQTADDTFSLQVIRDLYEGLTAVSEDGNLVPGVAESWVIDPDGLTISFKLRPNARWSDGNPVQASDFVTGMRHAVDPKTASGSASLLNAVKNAQEIAAGILTPESLGVYATDSLVVRLELAYPAPYILYVLSQPIAAPRRPENSVVRAGSLPTNGPYYLKEWVAGSYIDLLKNPFYWAGSQVKIEHVRYITAESEATELREYLAGQLDITFTLPIPDFSRISATMGTQVQTTPILGTQYLALNLASSPLAKSRDLRKALSMTIDRDEISKNVVPGVTPAYTFVATATSTYASPRYDWEALSQQDRRVEARRLYALAGYSQSNPLHLKLYHNSGESVNRIMLSIAAAWKRDLGVICDISSDEFRVFLNERKDRSKWDVTRLGWSADYDDPSSFLEIFLPGSHQNDPDYSSDLYSALMSDAKSASDASVRLALLAKAEQQLLGDYPIIPIYYFSARRLVKPYLGGAVLTPMNATYSKHLYWKPTKESTQFPR